MIPSPLRAIFFDLDNTLLDHSSASRSALHHIHDRYSELFAGIGFDRVYREWVAINDRFWHDYSLGLLASSELRTGRFDALVARVKQPGSSQPGSMGPSAEEMTDLYLEHLITSSAPYDGVVAMLEQLRGRYQLGIISNGFRDVQWRRLHATGLAGCFDHVILSEEVGAQKPDLRIFQAALGQAGVAAAETLYIGDNFFYDIGGASRAGIRTIWFNPGDNDHPTDPPDLRPDAVARSIPDLARLLGIPLDLTSSL